MYKHKCGITLRKVEQKDLPDLLTLKNESWHGTHTFTISNMDDQKSWYDNMPTNTLCLILDMELSIGVCIISEINWISRTAKISGSVYKDHRKDDIIKGCCATGIDFAFEILNLHRLDAEVLETNFPAQRYEIDYLKFKVEGRRRKAVYKSGRYYDSLVIGLLREEWEQQDRVVGYGGTCNQTFNHDVAEKMIHRSIKYILKELN